MLDEHKRFINNNNNKYYLFLFIIIVLKKGKTGRKRRGLKKSDGHTTIHIVKSHRLHTPQTFTHDFILLQSYYNNSNNLIF